MPLLTSRLGAFIFGSVLVSIMLVGIARADSSQSNAGGAKTGFDRVIVTKTTTFVVPGTAGQIDLGDSTSCPVGKVVVGGGFDIRVNPDSLVDPAGFGPPSPYRNAALAVGEGWEVRFRDAGREHFAVPLAHTTTLTIQAICVSVRRAGQNDGDG